MVYNFHDMYVGRCLDLYAEFSEGEVELFKQILFPGNFAVEVGANIGGHTVFLAQAVWPTGSVLAFEPQRIVFQTLCGNLALNSISNVDARHAAVGNAPGEIVVPVLDYSRENNFGGLELGGYTNGERVPVITLDSLNLPNCDFLKVDAEGMEQAVLEGAAATIARCQPLMYVENDRTEKSAQLIRTIAAMGYNLYWHMPQLFQPNNYAGNPENVFGNIASFNMFCLPKGNRNFHLDHFQPVVVPEA
jgi:FkbM family methyltransferase